jgi:uncharacterized damage-inducible protein DinB
MDTFLRELLVHAEWANAMFFRAWEKSPARDHEELRQRMDHIVLVLRAFALMLENEPPPLPRSGPPPEFADLRSDAQGAHATLGQYVNTLDLPALSRRIEIPFFPDPPCVITVAEALVQVAMHTQHHRGQCMTRLKDFGGEPVNVDWIIWLWKQKPAPRWS